MNRYPLWKYVMVALVLIIAVIYTVPNFFGESPAVQVSGTNVTFKVNDQTLNSVETELQKANIPYTGAFLQTINNNGTVRIRFANTDDQIKAKDLLNSRLNSDPEDPDYTIALNLLPASPEWLSKLGANPMFLGLDLRGGVHFLLKVDMEDALKSRYESLTNDIRNNLSAKQLNPTAIDRQDNQITVRFDSADVRDKALTELRRTAPQFTFKVDDSGDKPVVTGQINANEIENIKQTALKQNMVTLHNRINELGVAEPVIQQQGNDRIVVQLPGIQDVAKAKEILGRTATLELRMVDDSPSAISAMNSGRVPFGLEEFKDTNEQPILLKRQVLLTGENLQNAQSGRDPQSQMPTVNLTLDDKGARIFRDVTRNNVNKRMAIVLFENGKGQVITAPVIRGEIPNGQVQISGSMSAEEAADTALLLRAGSLAAPMNIIEERTIGPSLGAENIKKGFNATLYGFIGIAIFMIIYYHLFGIFSTIGLSFNVLLLLAALSLMQATLTLPGIAAIALTLGMAIDANVLINERIREELRAGKPPQKAINEGFDRAWSTIFDSNLTSLIVGVALLAFSGPGPIRGFAVVHCIGILTSMFSSVVGVRAIVNLWYGRRKKLKKVSIGTVWAEQKQTKNTPATKGR